MDSRTKQTYWILTTELSIVPGGGIGTYVAEWLSVLSKKMEVTVFFMDPTQSGVKETALCGARVVHFPPKMGELNQAVGYETAVALSFDFVLSSYIQKEGTPYCIESQDYQGISYFILLKKALGYQQYQDLQFVIQCHGPTFLLHKYNHASEYRLPYYWIGEMEKFCIKAADICISPSRFLVEKLIAADSSIQRHFHVVRNPYRLRERTQLLETESGEEANALMVGKLSPLKGVLQLCEAMASMDEGEFRQRIEVAGDRQFIYHAAGETMESYLRKRYSKLFETGQISLLGILSPEQLAVKRSNAAFVVAPSMFDSFPYSVIEAMADEKPVLVSASGGQAEIIEQGISGMVVDVAEVQSFREAMKQMIETKPAKRAEMGRAARSVIGEVCNPERICDEKMRIIEDHAAGAKVPDTKFPFLRVKSVEASVRSQPGVSVVIPYYEMGDFLGDALNSLFDSELQPAEIIIVDDGSERQPAASQLAAFKQKDRIQIIQQRNQGLPTARNVGASIAKADYLAFLDPDDRVLPSYYRKAADVMDRFSNVHFVGCWTKYFGSSSSIWPALLPEPPYLLYHNMVNSSSLLFRRESFMNAGLNDPSLRFGMEDYSSVIGMVRNGFAGVAIPEVLFEYRVRRNSMARSFNKANLLFSSESIVENNRAFFDEYGRDLAALNLANGPGYAIDNPTLDYHIFGGQGKMHRVASLIRRNKMLKKISLTIYNRIKKTS